MVTNPAFTTGTMAKKCPRRIRKMGAKVIDFLPELQAEHINLCKVRLKQCRHRPLSDGDEQQRIIYHLKQLMPWRKGPYHLHGIHVDCEWRSDFVNGDRVLPHLAPLKDRTILDVGCGSGYHMWRMVGEGAKMVVGIDPTELFLCQFEAVRKLLNHDRRAHLIPLGIEQMQTNFLQRRYRIFDGRIVSPQIATGSSHPTERSVGQRRRIGVGNFSD